MVVDIDTYYQDYKKIFENSNNDLNESVNCLKSMLLPKGSGNFDSIIFAWSNSD